MTGNGRIGLIGVLQGDRGECLGASAGHRDARAVSVREALLDRVLYAVTRAGRTRAQRTAVRKYSEHTASTLVLHITVLHP